jgi:hypothetical protein
MYFPNVSCLRAYAFQNMSVVVRSSNQRLLEICPPVESTPLDFVPNFCRLCRANQPAWLMPTILRF